MTEDGPHPLDYNATLDRMEPGISPTDLTITLASIAISMKRIATALENPAPNHYLGQHLSKIDNSIQVLCGAVTQLQLKNQIKPY